MIIWKHLYVKPIACETCMLNETTRNASNWFINREAENEDILHLVTVGAFFTNRNMEVYWATCGFSIGKPRFRRLYCYTSLLQDQRQQNVHGHNQLYGFDGADWSLTTKYLSWNHFGSFGHSLLASNVTFLLGISFSTIWQRFQLFESLLLCIVNQQKMLLVNGMKSHVNPIQPIFLRSLNASIYPGENN